MSNKPKPTTDFADKAVWSVKPSAELRKTVKDYLSKLPKAKRPVNPKELIEKALQDCVPAVDQHVEDLLKERERLQKVNEELSEHNSHIQQVAAECNKNISSALVSEGIEPRKSLLGAILQFTMLFTERKTEMVNLKTANSNLKAELENLSGSRLRVVYDIRQNEDFIKLRDELEKVLPMLLKTEVERIPVTDEEMVGLLVDYCKRDPSNEFPFKERALAIYERFKKENPQHEQQKEKTNGAGGSEKANVGETEGAIESGADQRTERGAEHGAGGADSPGAESGVKDGISSGTGDASDSPDPGRDGATD